MPLSNVGSKLSIATDVSGAPIIQNNDLTVDAFIALTWTDITAIGSFGETGSSVNILSYDIWGSTVTQKRAGITNAGDPEIEVAFDEADPGQTALRTAASPANHRNNYAIRRMTSDGTIYRYYRGRVLGHRHPNGAPEDFEVEIFTIALNQEEISVPVTLNEIIEMVSSAGGALYHPMNPDTAYQERTAGGTTLSGDNGPIGTLRDIGGGGYHAVAPSDAARPILTGGTIYQATYDDVDDDLQAPLPIIGATCTTWTVSDRGLIIRNDVRHVKAGNYRLPRYGLRAFGIIPGALTVDQRALLASHYGMPIIDAAWASILRNELTCDITLTTADASSVMIDWGDGVPQTVASSVLVSHTYPTAYSGPIIVTATAAITRLLFEDGNYDGNIGELPGGATTALIRGQNTYTGDVKNLTSGLLTVNIIGTDVVHGIWSDIPSNVNLIYFTNQVAIDVPTTTPHQTTTMRFVHVDAGLTSTEVDNLLIALAQCPTWTNEKTINLDVGTNGPRTTASDAAVATLTGYGVLVETNP